MSYRFRTYRFVTYRFIHEKNSTYNSIGKINNQKYGWKMQFHCPNLLIFFLVLRKNNSIKKDTENFSIILTSVSGWVAFADFCMSISLLVESAEHCFVSTLSGAFGFGWPSSGDGAILDLLIDDSIDDDTKKTSSVCPLFSHTHTPPISKQLISFLIHKFLLIIHSNPI